MKPARLFKRWCRQQKALLNDLVRLLHSCQKRADAEDVHQLRVVTRRLRQIVRLGAAWYSRRTTRTFRDWSRSISLVTDAIRDADVTLDWLARQPDATTIAARVTRQRARHLRRAQAALPQFSQRLRRALSKPSGGHRHEQRLHQRFQQLQIRLWQRLRRETPKFFKLTTENQHDLRRHVRRWRYLRELELPGKARAKDSLLVRLTDLQGVLGERQNLQLLRHTLDDLEGLPNATQLRGRLESEIRSLERRLRAQLRWLKG